VHAVIQDGGAVFSMVWRPAPDVEPDWSSISDMELTFLSALPVLPDAAARMNKDGEAVGLRYWLMKCEPEAYSIDDLERDGSTSWEGVRNYQARNFLRDQMQAGDKVLFYASNAAPSGVSGLAEIVRPGYPDHTAWTRGHAYFDAASTPDAPAWYMVDVGFVERFPAVVSLETLKQTPGLEDMMVTRKGSRLSVQPVTRAEYDIVVKLGRGRR
jgi:predicted RNA-binding protein with PUA-like domain